MLTKATFSLIKGAVHNIFDYGVVADGSDETAAINTALTTLAGERVYFPDGTYKITGQVNVPVDTDLVFGKCVIDATTASGLTNALIYAAGSISSAIGGGLTSSLSKGYHGVVSFNSAHGLSVGDLVCMRQPASGGLGSFNAARVYYNKGEFHVVRTITSTTQVVFQEAIIDDYDATTEVFIVTPTQSNIYMGETTILGNNASTDNRPMLYVRWGAHNKIVAPKIENNIAEGISLNACFHADIDCGYVQKYTTDSGVQSYSILLDGMYNVARHGYFSATRHGASMCGGSGGYICDRFNEIQDSVIVGRDARAADFHGGGELNTYRNCVIYGAGILNGQQNNFVDCTFYEQYESAGGTGASTLLYMDTECISASFWHKGNRFFKTSSVGYVVDMSASFTTNFSKDGTFVLEDCEIESSASASDTAINMATNGSTQTSSVTFINVRAKKTTGAGGYFIGVAASTGNIFNYVTIQDCFLDSYGLGICNVNNISLFRDINNYVIPNALAAGGTNIVADTIEIKNSVYVGTNAPTFTGLFLPSQITFKQTVDVSSANTVFNIWSPGANNSFMPTMTNAMPTIDVTATNGDYFSLGVSGAGRLVDYGVSASAAASSKYTINAPLRWISYPNWTAVPVSGTEYISLLSANGNTAAATAGSNMGGSANMKFVVTISGNIVGNHFAA